MKRVLAVFIMFVVAGCVSKESLPPQEIVDEIRIEQTYPNTELLILSSKEKVEGVIAFINTKKNGWSVPWYGAAVGQIYLNLYKSEKFVGNFYVGADFFGRDYGNFWSQSASEEEIKKLGMLLGLDLLGHVNATE